MTPRILSSLTIVKCSDGKYYQAVGDVFCPNIIERPVARVDLNGSFEITLEGETFDPVNPKDIFHDICDYFKLDPEKVMTKSRKTELVQARQLTAYFLRIKTSMSWKSIGEFMAGADHTTAIHSKDVIVDLLGTSEGMRQHVSDLTNRLGKYPNMNPAPQPKKFLDMMGTPVKKIPAKREIGKYSNTTPFKIAK